MAEEIVAPAIKQAEAEVTRVQTTPVRMPEKEAEPASQRVLLSAELLGIILGHLQYLASRMHLSAACSVLHALVLDPSNWGSVHLCVPPRVMQVSEPAALEACTFRGFQVLSQLGITSLKLYTTSNSSSAGWLRCANFPALVELDISAGGRNWGADPADLANALRACAGTLRALNVSHIQLFTPTRGYHCLSHCVLVSEELGGYPQLFTPLASLRVLVAFDADPHQLMVRELQDGSMINYALQHCPLLEELELGFESEFSPREGPCGEITFSPPVWCRPRVLPNASASPPPPHSPPPPPTLSLLHLSLRGYVGLQPTDLANVLAQCPLLSHLDVCSCQSLKPFPHASLAAIARTLITLNVRGTAFDDECAHTICAAGGQKLVKLNVSCTRLSANGLLALAHKAERLTVLDLCYAENCTKEPETVARAVAICKRQCCI